MTADAAEREAFERHFHPSIHGPLTDDQRTWAYAGWRAARAAIPARAPEIDAALREAERLAMALHAKHYGDVANWKPLSGDLIGLLSQIDNMTAGLPLPARAPEGWVLVPREPTPEMQQRGVEAGVAAGSRGEKWVGAAWAAMLSTAPPPPEQGGEDRDICPVCAEPLITGQECATDIEMGTCHATCLEGTPIVDLETGEPCDGPADTFPYEPETTEPLASPAPGPAEPEPFSDDWSFPHPEKRLIGKVVTSGPAEPKEARAWGTESDARRRLRKEVLTLLHYAASGNMKQSIDDAYLDFIAPLLPPDEPQPGPAEPVLKVLRREVQHYIECSDNGLSLVPRGLLTRILSALQPPQPAPAPVAEVAAGGSDYDERMWEAHEAIARAFVQ